MSDVEQLADEVSIVVGGRSILHRPLEELTESARRVLVRAPAAPAGPLAARPIMTTIGANTYNFGKFHRRMVPS
jgi:hypothetical protein